MYIYKNIVNIEFSEAQFLVSAVALVRRTLLSCLYIIYETELQTVPRLHLSPPSLPGPYSVHH